MRLYYTSRLVFSHKKEKPKRHKVVRFRFLLVGRDIYSLKARASLATNPVKNMNGFVFACSREPPRIRSFEQLPTYHKTAPPTRCCFVVGRGGFEPPKSKTSDLQSDPFGRSGICPYNFFVCCGAGDWTRTHNLLITNQLLCQLSYTGKWCILNFSLPCGNKVTPTRYQKR